MSDDSTDVREKMNIILKERKSGKSRELCARDTGIPITDVIKWYYGGKNGNSEDNIYFYEKLSEIEENLKKRDDVLNDFNVPDNVDKRNAYLDNIREGKTRREACEIVGLDFDKVTTWDSLGNRKIEPYDEFYRQYSEARAVAEKNNKIDNINVKNAIVNLIRKSLTLHEAASSLHGGKYENNIINWYNAGKDGVEAHVDFYQKCVEASKNPVNADIMAPLPVVWKHHFKKRPNKSGFAWVYRSNNKWFYSRKMDDKKVVYSDYVLKNLHKKVVGANNLWGVTDVDKAKKSLAVNTKRVRVKIQRINKNKFRANVQGFVKNKYLLTVLNRMKFFEKDVVKREIKQINSNSTFIKIEYVSDISILNSFEQSAKGLKWRVYR